MNDVSPEKAASIEAVHVTFQRHALRRPEATAARFAGETLTYKELDELSTVYARQLLSLGLPQNAIVGVYTDRGLEMLVAVLAVLKAGCCYLPLDPAYPKDRIEFMLADSETSVVLSTAQRAPTLPDGCAKVLLVDLKAATAPARPDSVPAPPQAGEADPRSYVIYTSGSTGKPKGVEVRLASLSTFVADIRRLFAISAEDVFLAVTTLSFDIHALELFVPLSVGASIVIASETDGQDGFRLRSLIRERKVSVVQSTPSRWRLVVDAGLVRGDGVRHALCGGEAFPPDLARLLSPRVEQLWNMYGPTETTIWSLLHRVDGSATKIPIGKPIGTTSVFVVDAYDNQVGEQQVGEILIGGYGVARGYLHRPDLTAQRFVELPQLSSGRLYRTGDFGYWGEDGNLYFEGRADTQTKFRGYRIELGEIESVLKSHHAIRDCVVLVRDGAEGIPLLVAYLTCRFEASSDAPTSAFEAKLSIPCRIIDGNGGLRTGEVTHADGSRIHVDCIAPLLTPDEVVKIELASKTEAGGSETLAARVVGSDVSSLTLELEGAREAVQRMASDGTKGADDAPPHRVSVNLPILLSRSDARTIHAHTLNVAEGGFAATGVPSDLRPGERIDFTLVMPDGWHGRGSAETVWCAMGAGGFRFRELESAQLLLRLATITHRRQPPSAAELRAHAKAKLPDYMIPTHYVVLSRLPLTPNGKIDRQRLPAPEEDRAPSPAIRGVPSTEQGDAREGEIAQIWAAMLGIDAIDPTSDFRALGGTSLAMARIVARVRSKFGAEAASAALFSASTVAQMARILEEQSSQHAVDPTPESDDLEGPKEARAYRLRSLLSAVSVIGVTAAIVYFALAQAIGPRVYSPHEMRADVVLKAAARPDASMVLLGSSVTMGLTEEVINEALADRGVRVSTSNLSLMGASAHQTAILASVVRSNCEKSGHRLRMGLVQLSYGHGSRAFRAKFGDANEATFRYQVGARYPGALAHTSLRDAAVIPLAVASGGTSPVVFRRLLNFLWPSRTPPDLALRWRYMTLSFKSAPPSCGMFPLLPPPGTTCFRDRLALEPAIEAEYRKSVGSQSALDDRILREERDLWGTEEDLEADEAEIRGSLVPEMETSVAELSVVSDRVVVFLSPIHPLLRRPGPVRTGRLRVTSELSEKKIDVIDYSEEESITARDFFDSDHLNMWGLQKLNALLADDVVRRLK